MRRLQLQERMTHQIAEFMDALLQPFGVVVVLECLHLCATMRGVKKHDARMTTSTMLGIFRSNLATREESLNNISRGSDPLLRVWNCLADRQLCAVFRHPPKAGNYLRTLFKLRSSRQSFGSFLEALAGLRMSEIRQQLSCRYG
jgi:hypothetical protein